MSSKRTMSEFMTIELLYDYKIGKLDSIRMAEIQKGLKNSAVARNELDKLSLGMEYCEELSQIEISDEFVKRILDQPTYKDKLKHALQWKNIPQGIKWGFEALLVSFAIIIFVTQFPKFYESDDDKPIIAQTFRVQEQQTDLEVLKEQLVPDVQTNPVTEMGADDVGPETPVETLTKDDLPAQPPVEVTTAKEVVQETEKKEAEINRPAMRKGYLHRISMRNSSIFEVNPEVIALIEQLGGKKAGEVELGWLKTNGSYFHFTIPTESYDLLVDGLKKYGDFIVDKAEHPRVMPDGVLRFIVWIEK